MSPTPARLALLTAVCATFALVAPAVAAADDKSFADTAIAQAQKLGEKESAASKALAKVTSKSASSIKKAQRRIAAVRTQTKVMSAAVRPQKPSSGTGDATKEHLLLLLKQEQSTYGLLDKALVKLADGDVASANRNLKSASKRLRQIAADAVKLGKTLAKLSEQG